MDVDQQDLYPNKSKEETKKRYKLIILGLIVHFLILFAVFDLYFASPLDNGMKTIKASDKPLAKRVFLIVADGLRAEAVYGTEKENRTPFLTNVRKHRGSWGTAHTRVPTESRPGHVAMLAGIYEDPSAILKGWKSNPVDFDSVINQSTNAWCWGSPDIINIFNKDNLPHISLQSYGSEMEDFGKKDTGLLDTWVFDRVNNFLNEDVANCVDCSKYQVEGNLYFLHLLGIDTAGHGYKPHSNEYIDNIKLVDKRVQELEQLVESIFKDGHSTYIFTSDHGMTDWGSHGAGSDHETEAPLIAWGPGIRKNDLKQDMKQIDIAPLIASLLGINIPTNSLGKLPTGYLDTSDENLSNLLISNTLQLLEIFNVKRLRTEENAILHFSPFKNMNSDFIKNKMENFRELYETKQFNEIIHESLKFMNILIEGLDYYHNYYQRVLQISISIGLSAWILFLGIFILNDDKNLVSIPYRSHKKKYFFNTLTLIVCILCYIHKFPYTYYFYFSFPIIMIYFIVNELDNCPNILENLGKVPISTTLFTICFYSIGIELLVLGFFYRVSYSVLLILVASWIIFSDSLRVYTNKRDKVLWITSCSVLAIFPTLSVMETSFSSMLYLLGYLGWLLIFYVIVVKNLNFYYRLDKIIIQSNIFYTQFIFSTISVIYMVLINTEVIPTDSNIKYLSWLLALIPVVLIPFSTKFIAIRLSAILFGFQSYYLLVSPNVEGLFSSVFSFTLAVWLIVECKSFRVKTSVVYFSKFQSGYNSQKKFEINMFRRSFLFMVFIFVGFFGTGNIASLNSFDPMWVRAFLTVFSPFKMTTLILVKMMIPFLFVCCTFRAINTIGRENILSMFGIILMYSDVMVMHFLYFITNQGSWLDIGMSLSHFIIMEAFVTILLLLYGFAQFLTTVKYSFVERKKYVLK